MVDEAHCIISWGKSKFRPAFMQLGLLRAIFSKHTKVLALTATATTKAQDEIITTLLMDRPLVVKESPDRQVFNNITDSGQMYQM